MDMSSLSILACAVRANRIVGSCLEIRIFYGRNLIYLRQLFSSLFICLFENKRHSSMRLNGLGGRLVNPVLQRSWMDEVAWRKEGSVDVEWISTAHLSLAISTPQQQIRKSHV